MGRVTPVDLQYALDRRARASLLSVLGRVAGRVAGRVRAEVMVTLWVALSFAIGCSDATHTVGTLDITAAATAARSGASGSGAGAAAGNAGAAGAGANVSVAGAGGAAGESFDLDAALPDPVTGGCAASAMPSRARRLDLYFMLGTTIGISASGGWSKITDGISQYAENEASIGTGLGLGFYGITFADRNGCAAETYAAAAVSAGDDPLPANATTVQQTLADFRLPTDFIAPLGPALDGAIRYARSRSAFFEDRTQAVVLVSDGFDDFVCMTRQQDMVSVAQAGVGAGVRTFVVELATAPNILSMIPVINVLTLIDLDPVAAAGGTGATRTLNLLADTSDDVEQMLLEIQRQAQPCDYAIPDGTSWGDAQLAINTGAGPRPLTALPDESACDASGGVFLDATGSTPWARACPASCAAIRASGLAPVWLIGCNQASAQGP